MSTNPYESIIGSMQAFSHIQGSEDSFSLVAFREGDKTTFKWVFDRLYKPLVYFTQNIINHPTDAEDIASHAFQKLYHIREKMESFEHIKRWLYVTVRNGSIDYLRLKSRNREFSKDITYLGEDGDERLEQEMIKMGILQSLSEAIEKLPRQRRIILRLYFFDNKSTAEIADELQLSHQTVRNQKVSALEALRKTVRPGWLLPCLAGIILAGAFFLMSQI